MNLTCPKPPSTILLFAAALLSACQATPTQPVTPAPTVEIQLTRYASATPAPPGATLPPLEPTLPPTATPTPVLYTIVAGDTLIGIAFRYGLTLADLLAANPGIDPQFLRIGAQLVIPAIGEEGGSVALPAPAEVTFSDPVPRCYPTADNGAWCFWSAINDGPQDLEHLSALVRLFAADGSLLAGGLAITPLRILQAGGQMPLSIYFPPPAGEFAATHGALQSALAVPADAQSSSELTIEYSLQNLGTSADVSGTLLPSAPVVRIVLVLIAYGPAGETVGMRQLVFEGEFPAGSEVSFTATVYSFGLLIDRVDVLAEAE